MASDTTTDEQSEQDASADQSADGASPPATAAAPVAGPPPAPPAAEEPPPRPPTLEEIAEHSQSSLIDETLELITSIAPETPELAMVRKGLTGFVAFLLRSGVDGSMADVPAVDLLIAELTVKLSQQIDEILHHPTFQELESAWRGLKFLVDRVDFRENVRIELLNASKRDLFEDFQDSPEIPKCGLYRLVYSAEYGQFGGRPFGLLVGNYEFTPSPQDVTLLGDCAAVATMAHAPFIAAAGPKFFGLDDFRRLPHLNEIEALFAMPQYTKWRAFRDGDDSRYAALCLPRFLLRLPYGPRAVRVRAFEYEERVEGNHEAYLWGNAAFAFASRVADSFARYRWCPNIIGPTTGGTVEDLKLQEYEAMGRIQTKIPTEIVVTERREFEISEAGFISFTYRRDNDSACFFSANSAQRPKTFSRDKEGRQKEMNHRLGTQLPYLFITCRLAHYIKVMQREQIGSWKEKHDLQRELSKWIMQYVADQEVVSSSVRARRPLRKAAIEVTEVAGNAGWYKVDLQVQPHFKFLGAVFQLGLVGRLDKE